MRFVDPQFQKEIKSKGFVVCPGILKEEDIREIETFYQSLHSMDLPFYTSNWVEDVSYKTHIHNFLKPKLDAAVLGLLDDCRSVYSYFLVKNPSEVTKVAIHQDWSLVDEKKYWGISMWIPLIDTGLENGCFCVMPYSHKIFNNTRGTNIGMPYADNGDVLEAEMMLQLPLKAGDAVFFDHRLVHFSPPNRTQQTRVAVGHVLVSKEAPLRHYYKKNKDSDSIFVQDAPDDLLLKFSFKQSPEEYFGQPATLSFNVSGKQISVWKIKLKSQLCHMATVLT